MDAEKNQIWFLSKEDILFIHDRELEAAGGLAGIRDDEGVNAAVDAPKASFGGDYLYDLFEMSVAYIVELTMRHPFVDGNKRTGAASALTFLYLNGYEITENYDEELADKVLEFVTHKIDREQLVTYLKKQATEI